MTITAHKAERRKAKLRLALSGASGSGKTLGALRVARGLVGNEGKILLIDTERGSGELYSAVTDYDVVTLEPPYLTEDYIEAIQYAEENEYDVVIIDSITHQWAGEGGMLEQADKMKQKGGNSFTVWAKLTPLHQKFVDSIIHSKIHVIATMRTKQDWVITMNDKGKSVPEKLGMAPIQRDGIDYEFTTIFEISHDHLCSSSKDRTGLFDGDVFLLDEAVGERMASWLASGTDAPAPKCLERPEPKQPPKNKYFAPEIAAIIETYRKHGWSEDVFKTARFDDDVWDKDVVNADYKKRMDALKAVGGQSKL